MTNKIKKVFLPILLIFFGTGIYCFVLKDTGSLEVSLLRSVDTLLG